MKRTVGWSVMLAVVASLALASVTEAQRKSRARDYEKKLQSKLDGMMEEGWKCEVNLHKSKDYKGKWDVELSMTMPIDDYLEFAPVAVLEAVAIPHNFPAATIYVRETGTRRVGSIAFRKAEPMGNKYRTGKPNAVETAKAEMSEAINWH